MCMHIPYVQGGAARDNVRLPSCLRVGKLASHKGHLLAVLVRPRSKRQAVVATGAPVLAMLGLSPRCRAVLPACWLGYVQHS